MSGGLTGKGERTRERPATAGAPDSRLTDLGDGDQESISDVLHLAELVAPLRRRFAIAESFPDDAILASLKAIAAKSDTNARIAAAFASNLGQHLERGKEEHRSAIVALVGLLPSPRS